MIRKTVVLATVLLGLSANGFAREQPDTREFTADRCKLTLGVGDDWFDTGQIRGATAGIEGEFGVLILAIQKLPKHVPVNQEFIKGFEKGAIKAGLSTKVRGELTQFKGVQCYDLIYRLEQDGSLVYSKTFAANGRMYSLQVMDSPVPLAERQKLDSRFAAFSFIGAPQPHVAKAAPESTGRKPNFSERMGSLAARLLILAVLLAGVQQIFKRSRRKKAAAAGHDSSAKK